VTAVDRPPIAFKSLLMMSGLYPKCIENFLYTLGCAVGFKRQWLEDVSGWQIGVFGNFSARRSLGRSTSKLG